VPISSNDQVDAQTVAQAVGATAASSNTAAVDGTDIVVLAVPYPAVTELAGALASALAGKVIVDLSNR
jgi:predicted dinucleotide-binding enzyme